MSIILMFTIFLIGVIIHELTHMLVHLALYNNFAKVKINMLSIKIIPTQRMYKKEKQYFLGIPIITGMIVVCLFMFHYPIEASLALIGYLISCGMDFYNMIKLEVKYK